MRFEYFQRSGVLIKLITKACLIFFPRANTQKSITIAIIIVFSCSAFTQDLKTINTVNELLKYSELAYGVDNNLVNGRVYSPKHALAKGHPYYPEKDWQLSTLYIKSKKYTPYQVKYNIEIDRLILNIVKSDSAETPIYLNTAFVDSVHLGENTFLINRALITSDKHFNNFFERVNTGKFQLLATYKVYFKASFTTSTPYGTFGDRIRKYFIYTDGKIYPISSKKVFLEFFEVHKSELKKYLKKQKINYKKADSLELKKLMIYCNDLYTQEYES